MRAFFDILPFVKPTSRIRVRAQELRREQTPAERALWNLLRDREFALPRFRRQHSIGIFIADFCCHERRLIVELDGAVHDSSSQQAWDENRDAYLRQRGYRALRFPNAAVLDEPGAVLRQIYEALDASARECP